MAGSVDAPFGFRPLSHLNGLPWNGGTRMFVAEDANLAMYIGDPIVPTTASHMTSGLYMSVDRRATKTSVVTAVGQEIMGVMTSRAGSNTALAGRPEHTSTDEVYIAADTDHAFLNAVIDPDVVYLIQEDGDTTTMTFAAAGKNCGLIDEAGSTVTGLSGYSLDSSSITAGATLPIWVMNLWDDPTNSVTDTYALWEVLINNHRLLPHGQAAAYTGRVLGI